MYDMSDYDNFYEPSEFDMMVEDFKEELRKSVATKWIERMNALEEENKSLQEIKKNFTTIKKEYENKKWQCEREARIAIDNAMRDAKRMHLKELLSERRQFYWSLESTIMYGKKCEKCNDKRYIHYKSPSGRDMSEECECAKGIRVYAPACKEIYEIRLRDGKLSVWFQQRYNDNDDYFRNSDYANDKFIVKDEDDITKIDTSNLRDLFFETEAKCQEFCDWYNKEVLKVDTNELSFAR